MLDVNACSVRRTQDNHYLLSWQDNSAVSIYVADNPQNFVDEERLGEPVLVARESPVTIVNPDPGVRHYFLLRPREGPDVVLAERRFALDGTANFRDFGGYETSDGGRVRWGRLYRSGQLSSLSESDMSFVGSLGVSLVCDFRQKIEQEQEPSRFSPDQIPRLAGIPITPGSSTNFITNLQKGVLDVGDTASFMEEINRDFVVNQMPKYAEMFELLLEHDHAVLIHCAAGKDRTGFGAALILDVLGVPSEQIMHDYLLTNDFLPIDDEITRLGKKFSDSTGAEIPEHVLRPMLEVRPEYLSACIDEINQRYESKQHFFAEALGLDDAKVQALKTRYLQ